MPAQSFGLCGPTFATRNPFWNQERVINWYPSVDGSGGHAQSKTELAPVPGLVAFATLPASPVRGLWAGDEKLYAVGGSDLFHITSPGVPELLGSVGSATTPVQIAGNGDSLLVASGSGIWITGGGIPVKVADGISCVYVDGYYVILWPDRQTIQISTNGSTWDGIDVATKIGTLDPLVHLEIHEGHLWMFGTRTISVWHNSGNADFPFEPIQGAMIEQGTLAPWSVHGIEQSLYWVGSDENGQGRVFRSQGYTPVRISNEAVEYRLRQYIRAGLPALQVDDLITGSGYEENGHTFYVIGFPRAQACLVYDLTTDMWHERGGWDGAAWQLWKGASFHVFTFGRHIVARAGLDGKLYEQNVNYYTEDGTRIRRYRAAPFVQADQQWLFHHYLRLLVKESTASAVPVTMRYLNDDQSAWSSGRTVQPFRNEIKYRRLGRARSRMYEISVLDSTTSSQAVVEGYLKASPGVER